MVYSLYHLGMLNFYHYKLCITMKKIALHILFFIINFSSCNAHVNNNEIEEYSDASINYTLILSENKLQNIGLQSFQKAIQQAANEGFISRNTIKLDSVEFIIDSMYTQNKNNLLLYWTAYTKYFKTIIYLQNDDKINLKKENIAALGLLESIKNKNSDDYALLAILKGLSFLYTTGARAPFIANDIKKNIDRAIKINPGNIRAYYAQGNNDYYTPKAYGGGKIAEKSFIKAITLQNYNVDSSILPSWGKEESYEQLIKIYIEKENWKSAIKYFNEAIKMYPENYMISKLGVLLVGKS